MGVASKAKARPDPLSEPDLLHALGQRFCSPSYSFIPGVRNTTGYARTVRTADAIAMSLWPSRGLDLHGFELKSSRSDWKRELDNPEKAEEICAYCDRWWVVVGDESIIQPGELPGTWGLLAPRGQTLIVKVEAPQLTPKPLDRKFLAAIMRRLHELRPDAAITNKAVTAALEAQAKRHLEAQDISLEREKKRYETLEGRIQRFEEVSCVKIDRYPYGDVDKIGAAVRFVVEGGIEGAERKLHWLKKSAEDLLAEVTRAIESAPKDTVARLESVGG